MSFFSSWRTALRVAQREARRSKGRSALVIAMIALPVLCLSFAAVSYDMFTLTAKEKADRTMGSADARVSWPGHIAVEQDVDGTPVYSGSGPDPGGRTPAELLPGTTAELSTVLPAGSRVLAVRKGTANLKTADGVGQLNAVATDGTSPLVAGYLSIVDGRAPAGPNEIAVSQPALGRLGAALGGTVQSADLRRTYTVVGLVEFPSQLEQTVLLAPIDGDPPAGISFSEDTWLVDTPGPIDWAQVGQLNRRGILVVSREVLLHPPVISTLGQARAVPVQTLAIGTLVSGLALLEIVLLAGPAFAVSARRRQRQLALVAANGGTPAHVRRIVLADGVVLGLVGAGFGIVAGIAAAFAARPFIEVHLAHFRAGAHRIFPTALLAIAALAVLTGVLAALVPAFITARQNVVAALAGRRGITRSRKRWLLLGLVMVGIGTAVVVAGASQVKAQIMLGGLVVGELGLVLCTPSLVGLIARIGRILPVAPRVALRDAARNRAAAAPAISAVMAAVAGSVALGLYFESDRVQQAGDNYQSSPVGYATIYLGGKDPNSATPPPSQAQLEAVARNTLPVADIKLVSAARCPGETADAPFASDSGSGLGQTKVTLVEHYCEASLVMDPAQVCPFQTILDHQHFVTTEQARAANADPRCAGRNAGASSLGGDLTVDDGSALADLTGAAPADVAAAKAVLQAGGVVVTDPRFQVNGVATLVVLSFDVDQNKDFNPTDHVAGAPHFTLPAYVLPTGVNGVGPFISPAAAAKAGLAVVPRSLIVATTQFPTQAQQDRFQADLQGLGQYGSVQDPPTYRRNVMLWIVMAAAGLITLGAAGIGTGLAAGDGRADLSTLAAVGASPRLRRGLSLSQSAVIAGLGSLLGAGAGLGAAMAVLVALNRSYLDLWPGPEQFPLAVPWLSLGVALLVVPLLAMGGAGLLTRSRLPIERRI